VAVLIILEECRWDKTDLGKLGALPEKGKPVNKWNPQAGAWKSVADGLAKIFENLIEKRQGAGPRQ
jgi:hypothetical protein